MDREIEALRILVLAMVEIHPDRLTLERKIQGIVDEMTPASQDPMVSLNPGPLEQLQKLLEQIRR
jgi:hypothetical protein